MRVVQGRLQRIFKSKEQALLQGLMSTGGSERANETEEEKIMTKWYKVGNRDKVEEVDVIKETPHRIYISSPNFRSRWINKLTESERWFPSEKEAIQDAVERQAARVDGLKKSVVAAEKRLGDLEELGGESA